MINFKKKIIIKKTEKSHIDCGSLQYSEIVISWYDKEIIVLLLDYAVVCIRKRIHFMCQPMCEGEKMISPNMLYF